MVPSFYSHLCFFHEILDTLPPTPSGLAPKVRTFVKNEDQNFSLFNYVNEQQNDVEKLEEQLHQLEEEEQKFAQESGSDVHQHKQALKDLHAKLQVSYHLGKLPC